MSIAGYAGWPAYDTFLIVLLSGRPIYDPNPLRLNPNPEKPMLGSCRVRRFGRTLTPLLTAHKAQRRNVKNKFRQIPKGTFNFQIHVAS